MREWQQSIGISFLSSVLKREERSKTSSFIPIKFLTTAVNLTIIQNCTILYLKHNGSREHFKGNALLILKCFEFVPILNIQNSCLTFYLSI